ncbi:hypothetical protein [Streptomyces sp. enrichment culture]|uniref:hypothetical protein n=1 Tax=Streptomyces sp. enrichment culture TaxID=1795815 RepID=UPI003F55D451
MAQVAAMRTRPPSDPGGVEIHIIHVRGPPGGTGSPVPEGHGPPPDSAMGNFTPVIPSEAARIRCGIQAGT